MESPSAAVLTADLDTVIEAVVDAPRRVLVVGGPGTGKTTCLRRVVTRTVTDGVPLELIVVLTHERPAAQRLRREIIAELGTSHLSTTITTVHGWCQHLLADLLIDQPVPRLLTAPEQDARLRELLSGLGTGIWPDDLQGAIGTHGFVHQLRVFLARVRQLGMDPSELAELGDRCGVPEWRSAARLFATYLDIGDSEQVIDYAELVHRTRLELARGDQARRVASRYDLIVVDELAEMDPSMINLIADVHRAGPRVVAFADPTTSVFDFRGTDPRAVTAFAERFAGPGESTQVFLLTDNLRSHPQIAAAVARVSSRLPARGPVLDPVDQVPQGPWVRAPLCPDQSAALVEVARTLLTAHLDDGIPWSNMAVITRAGHSVVTDLAQRLNRMGVPVRIAGDEIALGREPAVKHLVAVLEAAADLADGMHLTDRQVAGLLCSPIGGCDRMDLIRMVRRLRGLAVGAGETPGAGLLAGEFTEPHRTTDETWAPLIELRDMVTLLSRRLTADQDVASVLWTAWSATGWPAQLRRRALADDLESGRANADLDAIMALFDLAQRSLELRGVAGTRQFLQLLNAQQIAADTARENHPLAQGVTVSTVHRVKGDEFDIVAVVGAQEGAWPRSTPGSGLLRTDDLLPARDQGQVTLARQASLADHLCRERRSFVLAASRARRGLLVPVTEASDDLGGPSRFVRELGVDLTSVSPVTVPVSLDGLVCELRRTLTASSAPALAAGAGHLLWELAQPTDRTGHRVVPGASPDEWWELRGFTDNPIPLVGPHEPVRLSPSSVEALLTCPRAWFLDRRAGGAPVSSGAATVGRIIHELVERAASTHVAATTLLDAEPEILDALDGPPWRRAGLASSIREAAQRYDAWVGDPDSRHVVGVELDFQVPLTVGGIPVVIAGQVDRVESDGQGRLRIIDFKTGGQAFSQADVDVMDQLGIYQMVARLGAFESHAPGIRECSGAEIVHLRVASATGPTVRRQAPISDDEPWVIDHLTQAATLVRTENFEARANPGCERCSHRLGCPIREARA